MARKKNKGEQFERKERVVVIHDLPGIPEGTGGKVVFVEGFSWIRYWVRFDNGVVRGSLDRKTLARPEEWIEIQRRRAAGESDFPGAGGEAAAAAAAAGGGEAAAADAGEDVVVNGVSVPGHLIARSQRRREVLAGT